jgi:hypothetical protein
VHRLEVVADAGQAAEHAARGGPALARGAQHAGEHDRHGRARAGPLHPVDLAQHAHAADQGVLQVAPQLMLQPPGTVGEGAARRRVHLEEAGGAEVADQRRHLLVHGQAIEREQVEREAARPAPGGKHLGVDAAHRGRRRDAVLGGELLEPPPGRGGETATAVSEPGRADGGGIAREREIRRRRQG